MKKTTLFAIAIVMAMTSCKKQPTQNDNPRADIELTETESQLVSNNNDFCKKMLTEAPSLDKMTKVMIGNTIFVNSGQGYELKPSFVEKANTYYNASPESRDFNDGRTLDAINQWASDHTEQMITKALREEEFNPEAVSYLLNAIYFKGEWSMKFNKNETTDEPFNNGEKVPMMHQECG
ncbi:MAG: hypothetical protein IJ057_10500 [Bacteroidales bacterium]|nr:hypothetical protein [Bacteroidales bacterium]